MFCSGCGQELVGEVNFCPKCGKASQSVVVAPAPKPSTKLRKLWKLHTYRWLGECPVCRTVHTYETARCPNDDSPLVVAFDCRSYYPGLPMETAHLCCSRTCGFQSTATTCTNCGALITGSFVSFRIPPLRNLILQSVYFPLTVACLLGLAYSGWVGYILSKDIKGADDIASFIYVVLIYATIPLFGLRFLWFNFWWWKFRVWLDFERCLRR